jgi:hypothetical protein
MVRADELDERKALIESSPDLNALKARLMQRAEPLLQRSPPIPRLKALLSKDGGICPHDSAPLVFDPWSAEEHRCSQCGQVARGDRHNRNWARFQHLWLSERAAHLAAVGVFADDDRATERAAEILRAYGSIYFELPNNDNVLGPTHLFFSTYLESLWLLNVLAAATLLRESGRLDEDISGTIDSIANEAANVIGEFNEGFSNRQTWHAAALTAVASWFDDEELARSSIEGRTGLLGHLADGFGEDGAWYEGENYHLFALRGLLTGLGWARSLGADLLSDPEVAQHMKLALLAPARTALPDFAFPARKDSRFGVSLAQPMYLELWEVGRSLLGPEDDDLAAWLSALYRCPAQSAFAFESYLHEAGEPAPNRRSRSDLSWWSLLTVSADLVSTQQWRPESRYFRSQGLAVLRRDDRYASLECGTHGGGHGHPDRLHLTLHAAGVYWLPDFGTGSYVSQDLFWYRSTLAHNAPLIDGVSQSPQDAVCEMFDVRGEWSWVRGRFNESERTLVAGPDYLLDVVAVSGADEHRVDLPWHLGGEVAVETPGRWEPVDVSTLGSEFVHDTERYAVERTGAIVLQARKGESNLRIHLLFDGELLRARAPGAPASGESQFFIARGKGHVVRMIALLDLTPGGTVREVIAEGDVIKVIHTATDVHSPQIEGWQIESQGGHLRLAGAVKAPLRPEPILTRERSERPSGAASWVSARPSLDGSGDGFDLDHPLVLDAELQYRRSEEPYAGPEYFSATGWVNYSDDELFLMVEVTKSDVWFLPATAPPLDLDNEVDDIHSDGIQVYCRQEGETLGLLIVPEETGGLRVSPTGGSHADPQLVEGSWMETPEGYRITLAIRPEWSLDPRLPLEFDLLVNEMRPGRQRRAGQLVWSGGNGWVYLRGDRQDPASFGILTLTH